MAGAIETFFDAWGAADTDRDAMIREAVIADVSYADPRGTFEGVDALCDYVALYSGSGPGAAAEVAEDDGKGGIRVRFFGDGWEQFGRYNVTLDDAGRITQISGVVEISA